MNRTGSSREAPAQGARATRAKRTGKKRPSYAKAAMKIASARMKGKAAPRRGRYTA